MTPTNSSILFACFTAGFCWILFSSWHPKEVSYTINGEIVALAGSVVQSEIRYTQDSTDFNFDKMRSIDVRSNGIFNTHINLEPNGVVYFYVGKDRYTRVRYDYVLSENNINRLGKLYMSSFHQELSYKQLLDAEAGPSIPVYHDECLAVLDHELNLAHIKYFRNLDRVKHSLKNCHPTDNNIILSAHLNVNGIEGGKVFFSLTPTDKGEAYIAKLPNADVPRSNRN